VSALTGALDQLNEGQRDRLTASIRRLLQDIGAEDGDIVRLRYVSGWRRTLVFELELNDTVVDRIYYFKLSVNMLPHQLDYLLGESTKTEIVHKAMQDSAHYRSAKPLHYFTDLGCLVVLGAAGKRLDKIIIEGTARWPRKSSQDLAEQYCKGAALWLNEFEKRVTLDSNESVVDEDGLMARVEREIVTLHLSAPNVFDQSCCRKLRFAQQLRLDSFAPADYASGPRHNDFAPWNLLCRDGVITVIDFADLAFGPLVDDAFQFADAMEVLGNRPLASKHAVLRLRDAFIKESTAVSAASPSARLFFASLYRMIRINALLNNSKRGPGRTLRRKWLLRMYRKEIADDLRRCATST
jgi:hypothetical protein